MTLTPEKFDRIAGMFVRGYSLDLIAEWGVSNGWTRSDAESVVKAKFWALDWSGRLQDRFRPIEQIAAMTEPRHSEDKTIENMIEIGLDHRLADVRRVAVRAENAVEALRRALVRQEEADAGDAVRRRRASQPPQSPLEPRSQGGWYEQMPVGS